MHKDVAKILIEGRTPEEIEKFIIVIKAAAATTEQKQSEFQNIIKRKWDEYCDLMVSAPKISAMFEMPLTNRDILLKARSNIQNEIWEKERGFKSYFLKNEVKKLTEQKDLLDEKIRVFDEAINKRFEI